MKTFARIKMLVAVCLILGMTSAIAVAEEAAMSADTVSTDTATTATEVAQ
jgi:hypothetical protein